MFKNWRPAVGTAQVLGNPRRAWEIWDPEIAKRAAMQNRWACLTGDQVSEERVCDGQTELELENGRHTNATVQLRGEPDACAPPGQ